MRSRAGQVEDDLDVITPAQTSGIELGIDPKALRRRTRAVRVDVSASHHSQLVWIRGDPLQIMLRDVATSNDANTCRLLYLHDNPPVDVHHLITAQRCQVPLLSLECASCDAPNKLFLEHVVNDQRNDGCNRKAGHLKAPLDIVLPIQEHNA